MCRTTSWYAFSYCEGSGGAEVFFAQPELLKEVAQLFADGESFIVQARAGVDAFVRTGTIRPVIDATFKFEDALKAYELQMSGRAKGKVVVLVD